MVERRCYKNNILLCISKHDGSEYMSAHEVTLKPIGDVARYLKNLIPAGIPETYALKPVFESVANEDTIRNGVIAFREFLNLLCDRLISDGYTFAKPPKTPTSMTDYPFLHNLTNLLVDIGYYGKLAESGDSLLVTELPLCTATIDKNGKKKAPKIPASSFSECLRFLSLCGCVFSGISIDVKTVIISETQPLKVLYPQNPVMLTGLKALSIADMELRTGRRYWNDNNLLRCDYRLLIAGDTDINDELTDFLHPLPKEVREYAEKLHQRYTGMGLTCSLSILDDVSISYANIANSRRELSSRDKYQLRIWAFNYSIKHGYSLFVRAKKTDKYAETISTFPPLLQEKITAGYGCYKKFGRSYCQHDCQGIRLPLDESILDIGSDIMTWLDCEMPDLVSSSLRASLI